MITEVTSLARRAVLDLKAYKSARSLTTQGEVFLDANESPWRPEGIEWDVQRYPEPQPAKLLAKLSEIYGVPTDYLMVGRGTDDAIDVLVRTFCEAGRDEILICPPTYGVYEIAAQIQGAKVLKVVTSENDHFAISEKNILASVTPQTKLVFVCTPNNPTGNVVPLATIESLAKKLMGKALLVVDEAYIEFANSPSSTVLIDRFPNIVVLRTLSKAYGLAGARCGTAISHPEVTKLLQKVRAPYPLSAPTVRLVLKALENTTNRLTEILEERKRIAEELQFSNFIQLIFPSDSNFILFKCKNAAQLMETARSHGIILRDRSGEPGLENCIRITVGTKEENDAFLKVLREMN